MASSLDFYTHFTDLSRAGKRRSDSVKESRSFRMTAIWYWTNDCSVSILNTGHCKVCFKESFTAWERQKQRNQNPDLPCHLYLSILMMSTSNHP